jgi:hypothetical protein
VEAAANFVDFWNGDSEESSLVLSCRLLYIHLITFVPKELVCNVHLCLHL